MTKWTTRLIALAMFGLVLSGLPSMVQASAKPDTAKEVNLTAEQQKVLGALYEEVLQKRKEIINKYVEYGILTPEAGKEKIARLQKKFDMMKESGFVPPRPEKPQEKGGKKHSRH